MSNVSGQGLLHPTPQSGQAGLKKARICCRWTPTPAWGLTPVMAVLGVQVPQSL